MVQNTIVEMMPFLFLFIGQIFILAAVFTISVNQGEDFFPADGDYTHFGQIPRSFIQTIDFTQGKDEYKFSSVTGCIVYVLGLLYLNIIILNLVIALTGDVFEATMANKVTSELSLKANMLSNLYDLM